MFYSLGLFAYRHRWAIILVWAVLLLASTPLIPRAGERLQFGGFVSQRMESVRARELLEQTLGFRAGGLVVLYTSPTLRAGDPEFERQVAYSLAGLQGAPGVERVVDHLTNPRQISRDGHTVYELVVLADDAGAAARRLPEILSRLGLGVGGWGLGSEVPTPNP